uniref:Uncharacterized protein n=1 Tax=uncultured bacterium Contigcl_22 TaxID=1393666 RepID=W0FQ23_9BACT|nr:hypothetical protein [uncultured bacterium Contigcl_22]
MPSILVNIFFAGLAVFKPGFPGEKEAAKIYLKKPRGYAIIETEKPDWLSEKYSMI